MKITLSPYEATAAATIGMYRRISSSFKGRTEQQYFPDKDRPTKLWGQDIEGALAEMAVCKALNTYWSCSVDTFTSEADIGKNKEVRWTHHADGHLIVRGGNDPAKTYFLVTGFLPTYHVRGSIKGQDAMKPEYLKNPNGGTPCWMVPQAALTPFVSDAELAVQRRERIEDMDDPRQDWD